MKTAITEKALESPMELNGSRWQVIGIIINAVPNP